MNENYTQNFEEFESWTSKKDEDIHKLALCVS